MELDDLYQDIILDHYRHPRRRRPIPDGEAIVDEENPVCGDRIKLMARLRDRKVEDIAIDVQGCAICTASASMMAERAYGATVDECKRFAGDFIRMMRGGPELPESELGELAALRGVRSFPIRVKCATMPWHALETALSRLERESAS
ncbi:MAG: SUF system NifU family Fe-S cluster assembly protein [Kiritimatiellae bacterium]|nr:SUF system NifU family Fe-S cluster assembly protein [Kiritimatiellia bacterium]MDW8458339.1 SUF system NifU family Fe-S cluster assembly protein [Verrucomicrobiota bacterium]